MSVIGQATTDANQVLLALNPRSDTIRADWRRLSGFSDAYSDAAQDILATLNAASTTATTVTANARQLDALLLATTGLSNKGIELLAPNKANLIKAINTLQPTTDLLLKYSPTYTCLLIGAKYLLDHGGYEATGGNGKSLLLDTRLDARRRPVPLPAQPADRRRQGRTRRKAELRFAAERRRQLAGAPARSPTPASAPGMDWRPNPGIAFPAYGNYLPGHPGGARNRRASATPSAARRPDRSRTRAPSPTVPSCTRPTAPCCGPVCRRRRRRAPRDPGPTPGSEPFVVTAPGVQPTPLPPLPLPVAGRDPAPVTTRRSDYRGRRASEP